MSELEGHLLNALENWQHDYMRRLNAGDSACAELQKMHAVTQQTNAILNERVVNLCQQGQLLAGQVDRLSRLFIQKNR